LKSAHRANSSCAKGLEHNFVFAPRTKRRFGLHALGFVRILAHGPAGCYEEIVFLASIHGPREILGSGVWGLREGVYMG